jgi:hypothetical protein
MILQNQNPKRFRALSEVKVSEGSLPFYECEKGREFNLPKGRFLVSGEVKELPFSYKKIDFPDFDNVKPLKALNIVFVDNYPNKCSVWLDTGKVVADTNFKYLPSFVFMYIMFHEVGHFYFRGNGDLSEIQCDTFARKKMIECGYNPSQIDLAIQVTLSNNSDLSRERKKISFNQLKK